MQAPHQHGNPRLQFPLPQPLEVRLVPPEEPALRWRDVFRRHPRWFKALLLALALGTLFLGGGLSLQTALSQHGATEAQLDADCPARVRLDYPYRATAQREVRLWLTLWVPIKCEASFTAQIVLRPVPAESSLTDLLAAPQPLVLEVNLPPGGMRTWEVPVRFLAPGQVEWQVAIPEATTSTSPLGVVHIWPAWVGWWVAVVRGLFSWQIVSGLSALLGWWKPLRAWLVRLQGADAPAILRPGS